ncbi:hypothetical protein, partial [Mesomycoplasma ovipneumoniae]|uniref:hypothetical protein n=1 Tax=Mesomycoplasma ovipneumoniae TaxID=29562 RepID=UPI003080B57A
PAGFNIDDLVSITKLTIEQREDLKLIAEHFNSLKALCHDLFWACVKDIMPATSEYNELTVSEGWVIGGRTTSSRDEELGMSQFREAVENGLRQAFPGCHISVIN